MMRKLLRKDWRVYRPAVVGAAVLAVCPYAFALLMYALYPPEPRIAATRALMDWLEEASGAGLGLTLVTAAVFGGMAFAAERREGPAAFLAMLPVTRRRIVASKLLVALPCVAVPAAVHAYVAAGVVLRWEGETRGLPPGFILNSFLQGLLACTCVFVLLFGLAWALSLNLRSPAIAATAAFGLAVILLFVTSTWAHEAVRRGEILGREVGPGFPRPVMASVCVAVGAIAFLVSTAHYLRRVEP